MAFDSHLITLHDIKRRLLEQEGNRQAIIATGVSAGERQRIKRLFHLGSEATNIIALCSDALAEGVNLQAASALVQLDMPSVIRIAEQRIGRVDRMDSPHDTIEVYWPLDSSEFALRSDERFFERHRFVSELLGSNMPLPESLSSIVTPETAIAELEAASNASQKWDDLQDAFEPVRTLVSGNKPLVPNPIYEDLRNSRARVISSVSVVEANHSWAFFAIKGNEWSAPRWVYFDNPKFDPITDLELISYHLQQNLGEAAEDLPFDNRAAQLLSQFLDRLSQKEDLLLPKKKQRAIHEMRKVLEKYLTEAKKLKDRERTELIQKLHSMTELGLGREPIDLSILAERWLDLIRPVWYLHLSNRRRTKPLLLKNLRPDLIANPLSTAQLREAFNIPLNTKPIDEQIVAAILGVS